jgi:hypothetical protein
MTRYSDTDALSQAGDRLLGAAHPEARLLLAAGCCLLINSRQRNRMAAFIACRCMGKNRSKSRDLTTHLPSRLSR